MTMVTMMFVKMIYDDDDDGDDDCAGGVCASFMNPNFRLHSEPAVLTAFQVLGFRFWKFQVW